VYSNKLVELRELLLYRLGFGGGKNTMRNKVLIFAQNGQMIDIVCKLVLDLISGLTYDKYDERISSITSRDQTVRIS
jgi:SNF2 family DNA or RNA helicase